MKGLIYHLLTNVLVRVNLEENLEFFRKLLEYLIKFSAT